MKPKKHETAKNTGALKLDKGKVRVDLFPHEIIIPVSQVMQFSAETKYEDHNWRKGMKWSKLMASLERHWLAFVAGENVDHESKLPTLAHLICDAAFLLSYQLHNNGEDDRTPIVVKTNETKNEPT